ncbi:hypothetical protein TPHA_0O01480 [Tetrapisispora phaffii CBS 4417]|uniref:GPI ethanolamine phosphate transferase 2 n=1 Tax=Tetrapisispora phaffii (strain ATCC 24235 / CBS 4417 / NBRC 1672 / NRRL Y-8282 / UCD 70-5) TaxID=1071381 RepID=G8C1T7_TETPH|nr:hypothetical protein TPHA_0O01480 [Tetrapisispora phaffii CBS 4417]CCE66115.1 hypothetical protein TPHA_0O01480 [Tetrapisispora phaffii CBS 4417]
MLSLKLLLFQLIAITIFCVGFFPSKNVLQGSGEFNFEKELQLTTKPVFTKLVFVVIDALRSDFLYEEQNSHFHFVHRVLNSGEAWGFTAFSNPPTVTLPRLKGITTGSTPNFLDAILNVAEDDVSSSLKDQDSWLMQFYKHNKNIRFFGDDTWLKLFPLNIFSEYEGTNSFFVSDFEQVDLNVTRHLEKQFKEKEQWDVLILHYLGLDHIGHKGGSQSKFMKGKHEEMDSILEDIYNSIGDTEDTLLCVMGDHGMNNGGNHGGSSSGETSAGLTMISKKFKKLAKPKDQINTVLPIKWNENLTEEEKDYKFLSFVQQVDFVPTLSALFNLPMPINSVGVLIPELLRLLDPKLTRTKLKENFSQLTELSKSLTTRNIYNAIDFQNDTIEDIISQMQSVQSELMKSATNYNMNAIYIAIILLSIVTLIIIHKAFSNYKFNILPVAVSLIIGLSSFASSFIEEEHQIWWWLITGMCAFSLVYNSDSKFSNFIVFLCLRLIRGWNNSGQKYYYPFALSSLLKLKYVNYQWYLNTSTILYFMFKGSMNNFPSFMSSFLLANLCLMYKVSWAIVNQEHVPDTIKHYVLVLCTHLMSARNVAPLQLFESTLIPLARLFFCCVVILLSLTLVIGKLSPTRLGNPVSNIKKIIIFLLIFQTSPENIGLYLLFGILETNLTDIIDKHYSGNTQLITTISLVMQYFTFYQFGNTNSIATIDLTNAYNGVSEDYNIYFVGWMMSISNYAPAIYWSMFPWIIDDNKQKWKKFIERKNIILLFNCISGLFLLITCTILRYHLFIWSVFSPKLCYYMMWNIFMNVIIGWILETLVTYVM